MEKTPRAIELEVVSIGNSRGARPPNAVFDQCVMNGESAKADSATRGAG